MDVEEDDVGGLAVGEEVDDAVAYAREAPPEPVAELERFVTTEAP